MSARMEQHTTRVPGWPDPQAQNKTLTLSLLLACAAIEAGIQPIE